MRALSLTRPWSWLVLHGGKTIENRVWWTSYRGPLVVHGAQSRAALVIQPYLRLLNPTQRQAWGTALERDPVTGAPPAAFWTGLLGLVDVVGCCTALMTGNGECTCGPWAMPDQCHWQLANPRPLPAPIPAKGALGLWALSPQQEAAVLGQVAA